MSRNQLDILDEGLIGHLTGFPSLDVLQTAIIEQPHHPAIQKTGLLLDVWRISL